jgi:hypothetical protein
MLLIPLILATALTLGDHAVAKKNVKASTGPLVELDYATYQGLSTSPSVNQWLGLRYAAPPTNDNRFRAPKEPSTESGVQQANKARHPHLRDTSC